MAGRTAKKSAKTQNAGVPKAVLEKQKKLIESRAGGEAKARLKAAEVLGKAVPVLGEITSKEASTVIDVLLKK